MFLTAEVKRFFEAWQTLRADGSIPHFRAVFGVTPPDLIPGITLLEHAPADRYIVRFVGTALVDLWGRDITGEDRLGYLAPRDAEGAKRNIAEILGRPCGLRYVGAYGDPKGGRVFDMEGITLPVGNDPDKPKRLLNYSRQLGADTGTPGLAEAPSGLLDWFWVDLGAGVPRRSPAIVYRPK